MLKFETHQLQRNAIAALAALVLTSVSVAAAVGPARAIETAPVYAAATPVSGQAHA